MFFLISILYLLRKIWIYIYIYIRFLAFFRCFLSHWPKHLKKNHDVCSIFPLKANRQPLLLSLSILGGAIGTPVLNTFGGATEVHSTCDTPNDDGPNPGKTV